MDANTIRNCDNLEDKIDCFIDAGMQYQEATSKIFKYKTFLKQAYKHLQKENIYFDKITKRDLKKRIQDRISERFFEHKIITKTAFCDLNASSDQLSLVKASSGQASSENPNGHYSNDFREGIVEIGTGMVFIASEVPPVQLAGGGLIVDGTIKVIRGTVNYMWPESDERNHYRERERERPSRDGMVAEREREGPIRDR